MEAKRRLDRCFSCRQTRRRTVEATRVKVVVSPGELAVRLEEGWVMCDSLIQQLGRPQQICFRGRGKADIQKKTPGAGVEIESDEIEGGRALDGQFLSGRDFGIEVLDDFLRDFTLAREHLFQIAIILLRPDVRIRARVD